MKTKAEKPKIFNRIVTVAACAVVAVTVIALALSPFIFREGKNNNVVAPNDGSEEISDVEASVSENVDSEAPTDPKTEKQKVVIDDYYRPDYDSTSTLHADEFLALLKSDGYYLEGANYRNFNTANIKEVVNITPKSISDETDDLEIFLVKDVYSVFMMLDGKIYRYDTVGGYHLQLCLWDYDGNGTKDLVSLHTFGSGLCYEAVSVTDLSTKSSFMLTERNDFDPDDYFGYEIKDGVIYIEGRKLTFENGRFDWVDLSREFVYEGSDEADIGLYLVPNGERVEIWASKKHSGTSENIEMPVCISPNGKRMGESIESAIIDACRYGDNEILVMFANRNGMAEVAVYDGIKKPNFLAWDINCTDFSYEFRQNAGGSVSIVCVTPGKVCVPENIRKNENGGNSYKINPEFHTDERYK